MTPTPAPSPETPVAAENAAVRAGAGLTPAAMVAYRELLGRVVRSSAFARSERLASFLTYVCEMTLKGREREINEQKIGQAVFGRSRDYDSAVDGIVRTQASRVRQRLEAYFSTEGADEPVRIVIQRGGYVPMFEARAAAVVEPPVALPTPLPAPVLPDAARSGRGLALPWMLCVVLGVALVAAILVNRGVIEFGAAKVAPRHPLWSGLFAPGKSTLVVAADSGLVMYAGLTGAQTNLESYLRGDQFAQKPGYPAWENEKYLANPARYAQARYTSFVDLEVGTSLTRMALARGSDVAMRYARDIRPNDLKSGDVILLGASEANPWVELFERNMNYVFQDHSETHVFSVVNRSFANGTALPGEPPRWDSAISDPQRRVYGVVAYLPNLGGNGNALILEGTSMSGTECAWDFVSDDSQLLPFLNRIRKPDGSVPHFELLLGSNNLSASAVRSTILSWRVVP